MPRESRGGCHTSPKAISRSSAISAIREGTSWKAATVLLRDFPVFTIEVDVIAFNSVPRAWQSSNAGNMSERKCRMWSMDLTRIVKKKDTLTFHVMIVNCSYDFQISSLLDMHCCTSNLIGSDLECVTRNRQTGWLDHIVCLAAMWLDFSWIHASWPLSFPGEARSNQAITACVGKQWPTALQHFSDLHALDLQSSIITFSAAASACEGQWLRSWQLLNQLRDARILTSGIPYNAVASACEKATEWKNALQIIMEVERNRLSTAVTYGFLVFALGGLGALCILHAWGLMKPCNRRWNRHHTVVHWWAQVLPISSPTNLMFLFIVL